MSSFNNLPAGRLNDLKDSQIASLSDDQLGAIHDREHRHNLAVGLNYIAATRAGKSVTAYALSQRHSDVPENVFNEILRGLEGTPVISAGKRTNATMSKVDVPALRGTPSTLEVKDMVNRMRGIKPEIKASQSSSVNNEGGFTVPQLLENEIACNYAPNGVALSKALQVDMVSSKHRKTVCDVSASVQVIGENDVLSDTSVAVASVDLNAVKVGCSVKVSNELVEDWVVGQGVDAVLAGDVSNAISLAYDSALFSGDLDLGDNIKDSVSIPETTVSDLASLSLADIDAALASVAHVKGQAPEVYCSSSLFHSSIAPLLRSQGVAVVKMDDGRYELNGLAVNFSDALAGSSASASGELLLVVGYLDKAVAVGSMPLKVHSSKEILANTDQTLLTFGKRGAVAIYDASRLAKVSIA